MIRFTLEALQDTAKQRPDGYLSEVLAVAEVKDGMVALHGADYMRLVAKYRGPQALHVSLQSTSSGGVGSELKRLLGRLGIEPTPHCSCQKRAAMMDKRGIDWCEQNASEIIGWLREESLKRGLPFIELAARALLKLAIARARRAARR
jgi:hypothetical protein